MYVVDKSILNKAFLFITLNMLLITLLNAAPVFYEIREKQLMDKSKSEDALIIKNEDIAKYIKKDDEAIENDKNKPNFQHFKDRIKLRQIYEKYNVRVLCNDLHRDNKRAQNEDNTDRLLIEGVMIDCSKPTFSSIKKTKIINTISIENVEIQGENTNFGINIK